MFRELSKLYVEVNYKFLITYLVLEIFFVKIAENIEMPAILD